MDMSNGLTCGSFQLPITLSAGQSYVESRVSPRYCAAHHAPEPRDLLLYVNGGMECGIRRSRIMSA